MPTSLVQNRPRLRVAELPQAVDCERAFEALFGGERHAFWLDSSRTGPRARFSFIGAPAGPLGAVLRADVGAGTVMVSSGGRSETRAESIFECLERELAPLAGAGGGLPFGLDCGFVGYLGYELKADCDGEAAHSAPTPDAALMLADRLVAVDHAERRSWALALCDADASEAAGTWPEEAAQLLQSMPAPERDGDRWGEGTRQTEGSPAAPLPMRAARPRDRYLADISECERLLASGDTYEVCLTNRFRGPALADPFAAYRRLRRRNPAPFAAFMRFGGLSVLSSSPERFLRIEPAGTVEARPIKGTAPRGATAAEDARLAARLAADEKCRAENVTIVDLLRNDLGRVCVPGTVTAPRLMEVESYETVHQLVSTVRGRLRPGVSAPACVRACFPPGSMTGAPKRRTMEIIDELEDAARGVYSGAIGYFGLGGGCDLSVAIRTVVADADETSVGAGGAIVVDSDPEAEYEEMLLKAAAPLAAIGARLAHG
jgi:para-aminobenzoate synthetase